MKRVLCVLGAVALCTAVLVGAPPTDRDPATTKVDPVISKPFEQMGLGSYCSICWTNTTDDWISNVTFGTINNTTGQEGTCSYGDYTNLSTQVAPNGTYPISVTFYSQGIWTECVAVWFDWNQDYVWDNVTERYDLGCGVDATLTGNIVVPGDALSGSTVFRVTEQYSSPPTGPCTGGSYGETEDYSVMVGEVEGACCLPDGSCVQLLPGDCAAAQGFYVGGGIPCSGQDCQPNGVDDTCDIAMGTSQDCQPNGVPDECDIAQGTSQDCQPNGVPDECDLASGTSSDCQPNGIPDECDIAAGTSGDCQPDGIPDECQLGSAFYHCSARDLGTTPNDVWLFDPAGVLQGSYDQIAGAGSDAWGYRDGACDSMMYVYFGWGGGVARHSMADGSGGTLMFTGSPPGGTWRAMAYDPTGDNGNGSLWSASFSSVLVEVDLSGNQLTSFPVGAWSLYGLAYDNVDGNLWGHDNLGAVIKIDTTTGAIIAGAGWPNGFPNLAAQGGLSSLDDGTGDVAAISQGTPDELGVYDEATGTLIWGPINIEGQTGSNGHLGVACAIVDNDRNCNGVPDECDVMGDLNCDGVVNAFDIDPFVLALTNQPGYYAAYPNCDHLLGDCNFDCVLDAFDIDAFVAILVP